MLSKLESEALFEATFSGFLQRQFTPPKVFASWHPAHRSSYHCHREQRRPGAEACRLLLQLGLSRLVMGVRSQIKGDEAAAQLRTTFPSVTISVWILDLESCDSIRAFADQCETLPRIDIAILNAGLMNSPYTIVPATKHDITMQVNYLSTALLAILLIPLLRAKKVVGAAKLPCAHPRGVGCGLCDRYRYSGPGNAAVR
jgi:NAD(P)-dependent dehydrogenase (short-subunit alcohol dehydrogenase family)